MPARANINAGDRYGKLTIIEEIEPNVTPCGTVQRRFKCMCDCGNETTRLLVNLNKDSGCKECTYKDVGERSRIKTDREKLYTLYYGIKGRIRKNKYCLEKGIQMCQEWANDFEAFYQWAINNGYQQGLTIDRIDNFGNYEPSNCRWVDNFVQASNKTTNVWIEYNGERKTLTQWSEITGKEVTQMCRDIRKNKYPIDVILGFTPKKWMKEVLQYDLNGNFIAKFENAGEAAESLGVTRYVITRCCSGIQKSTKGYIFKYASGEITGHSSITKKVDLIDNQGNILKRYISAREASGDTGVSIPCIWKSCKGGNIANGMKFRWNCNAV